MPGIKDLRDKVVVVTGAGSGIGRATALAFAREGAELVVADIDEERLNEVSDRIRSCGARVMAHRADVSKRSDVEAMADKVMAECGRVDVLVNNAGVAIGGKFTKTSIEEFVWIFSVNFWGALYGIKAFLPHMMARRFGHIVNVSSLAGLCAMPGLSAYSATKFALAGLSEALRTELRAHGIGVTTICPGVINTRVVQDGKMHLDENARANRDAVVDFYKRFGWPPERVARSIVSSVRFNRSVVPVGPEAWVQWFGKRLSQRGYEALAELAGRVLLGGGEEGDTLP